MKMDRSCQLWIFMDNRTVINTVQDRAVAWTSANSGGFNAKRGMSAGQSKQGKVNQARKVQASNSVGTKGGRKGKPKGKFNGTCFTCQNKGHKAADCKQKGAKDAASGDKK